MRDCLFQPEAGKFFWCLARYPVALHPQTNSRRTARALRVVVGIKPACWPHLQAAPRGCRERRKVKCKALEAPAGLRAPALWSVNNLARSSGQAHATSGTVQGAHMSFRSSCGDRTEPNLRAD